MICRSSLALLIVGTSLACSANAWAQVAGDGAVPSAVAGSDELTTLETNLASEHAALSTADCATACRALASIRRAAEKICALDPDERCASARSKADDASRRVREACPECAVASSSPEPPPPPMARPAAKGGAPEPGADGASIETTANSPPSESRRGGCAGCTTTGTSPADLGALGVALSTLALLIGRRRRR